MTTSTVSHIEALREACNLIKDERCWAREYLALDKHGSIVIPISDEAVMWCALGAIERACNRFDEVSLKDLSEMVRREIPKCNKHTSLGEFNDESDHADVIALFDKAIFNLQQGEGGGDARGG